MPYTLTEDRTLTTPADLHDSAPRVWIRCLHCYNAGYLVGEWYDATEAADVSVFDVHRDSGCVPMNACEELWVMDHDNLPISGECSPAEAARWGDLLDEVDEWQRDAFRAWVLAGNYSYDGDGMPDLAEFEDSYAGEWDSFREYAEELADGIGLLADVPDEIAAYFDWEAWTRDLILGGDYTTEDAPNGGVYVFRAC